VSSKHLSNRNSRWRPPPSWISKHGCHFFTIRPIFNKLSGNIVTSIKNTSITLKMHSCHKFKWRKPPSSISAIVCHFFTHGLKLVGILRLWYIHTWNRKGQVTKIQHGSRCYLDFRRSISICLPFDRLLINLVGMSLPRLQEHIYVI